MTTTKSTAADLPRRFLTMEEIQLIFRDKARSEVYKKIEMGLIPRPVQIRRRLLWDEREVYAFMDKLLADRDAKQPEVSDA